MKPIECFKVNIRLVHHVEGKRFWFKVIQFIAVVPFPVSDTDVCGDAATQRKQRMHLDRPLLYFPRAQAASLILVDIVVESKA